jgi:hypothetical protein
VGSGPPDQACVVRHGTHELLVEQRPVPDGQTSPPVKEGTKYTQSLSRLSSCLIDVHQPGQS